MVRPKQPDGTFATWVGTLITDLKQEILLITDKYREEETVLRLSRVEYDNTIGYLKGGFQSCPNDKREVETIETIDAIDFANSLVSNSDFNVLDVRKQSEYDSEHVKGVKNFPLGFINHHMSELKSENKYQLFFAGGYRSMIMASILKARGFNHIVSVNGGFKAIKELNKLELTEYVCPTTLL